VISERVAWRADATGQLQPFVPGNESVRVVWAPQPGSQAAFYECPVTEALFEGGRGNGKTDSLLMAFGQEVGRGYGEDWRGILFRRTVPELQDVIEKSKRWFRQLFPDAVYNETKKTWRFATGETLIFAQMRVPADYWTFHGHAYTFIAFEEITNWPTSECYTSMFSCLRSSNPTVPRKVRATCNPSGVGHNWVKKRFRLPVAHGQLIGPIIKTPGEPDRVAIHGHLRENRVLQSAEPDYADNLRTAARARGPGVAAAWIDGSWDIVSGGMWDDLWSPAIHVIPPIPLSAIPSGWRLDRAYDYGQSKPFSVGWWAESNGEPVLWEGRLIGLLRGDLVRVSEWYGWNGEENKGVNMAVRDVAKGIVEHEAIRGARGRVKPGPADSAIFNADPRDPDSSIASEMASFGVTWEPADKGPGSRKLGWLAIRALLEGAIPDANGAREYPGLFISSACEQFLRVMPTLPRSEKDPDDVDTECEDHIGDETRYRVRQPEPVQTSTSFSTPRLLRGSG